MLIRIIVTIITIIVVMIMGNTTQFTVPEMREHFMGTRIIIGMLLWRSVLRSIHRNSHLGAPHGLEIGNGARLLDIGAQTISTYTKRNDALTTKAPT